MEPFESNRILQRRDCKRVIDNKRCTGKDTVRVERAPFSSLAAFIAYCEKCNGWYDIYYL